MSITVSPARPNHAIWNAPPAGVADVAAEALRLGMGNPTLAGWPTLWCVRDTGSGAHLKVWSRSGPDGGEWDVAWIDGPGRPGSGYGLAEVICGEPAGGRLSPLPEGE